MRMLAEVLVVLVAVLHLFFLVLEAFLWNTPYGHKTFKLSPTFAAESAPLAKNQGLYNGFLAAGLLWGVGWYGLPAGQPIVLFFLSCVVVAAIVGALTVGPRIFLIQGVPALLATAAVLAQ